MAWPFIPILLAAAGAGAVFIARDRSTDHFFPPDPGTTDDERTAISFAYLYEQDPTHLVAFSEALLPDKHLASALLHRKAHTISPQTVGNIFEDVGEFLSETASGALDVLTHPADTASGAWKIITHPSDSISDFGNALVDALHAIPGMNEAGELLKEFARTGVGEWCLRVMATAGYYVMAPYLGAQLAAVSFALPGSAKAEPFLQSWITEYIDRVTHTINILLQQQGIQNLGTATSAAVNKALAENPLVQKLAKEFAAQVGKANAILQDKLGALIAQKIKEGASDAFDMAARKLAGEYGYPPNFAKLAREAGIREDNAAAAYDYFAHTNYQGTTEWDPLTGEDINAHLHAARFGTAADAGVYAPVSVYRDPRMMSAEMFNTEREVALAELLTKPPRRFWVDYYVGRYRFAEARRLAAQQLRYLPPATEGFSLTPSTSAAEYVPPAAIYQDPSGGIFSTGPLSR